MMLSRSLALSLCAAGLLTGQALDQPKPPAGQRPSRQAIEAWQARKFGMFIHFGLYSIPGGVWKGKRITNGYSEQIMSHAPIPLDEYSALAAQFNPEKFDPEAIVKLAEDAGMKFIVITSKHHDGFNLFRTKLTKYNVVDGTPYRRDIIKELSRACAKHGMKFGVYYSSIDWHDPRATPFTDDNNNPIPKSHEDFNVGQLKELTSGYGPLSEIWFDMGRPTPEQSKRFADTVHALQPDCMVSGRIFNNQGDFTVMGDNQIAEFVLDEPWQSPASIYTDTWGYRSWAERTDLKGKTAEHIRQLAQVVSRGGNYILNIGPRGDGSVVEFEADVLRGVGAWLKTNGEAVYGAGPQPFRRLDFGYAAVKQGRLYLFVEKASNDGRLVLPGLQSNLRRAYYLADPLHTALKVSNGEVKAIEAQPNPESPVTVVVAEYDGPLRVIPPTQSPDSNGQLVLLEKDADHFYNYNGNGYYDPKTTYKEQWTVAIPKAGRYRIDIVYQKPETAAKVDLVLGGHRVPVTLDTSKDKVSAVVAALPESRYFELKITPPEPFVKGEKLGAKIERVEIQRVN